MNVRILVAEDDPQVLLCYRKAFASGPITGVGARLAALSRELFVSGKRPPHPRAGSGCTDCLRQWLFGQYEG